MSEVEQGGEAEEFRAYPKSVQPGIPKLGDVPSGWSQLAIGELLGVVQRPVKMKNDESYELVTARRNRGGIISRGQLKGSQIATKSQFWVKAGDFIMSRRQIAHGACGVLPKALEGSLVSNEYAALLPTDKLDDGFLRHLPHSIYFQQTCFHSSIGVHVEKLVFKLEHWLRWPFLIPPLPEQRRIAAVLDAWDSAIALSEQLATTKRNEFGGLIHKLIDCSDAQKFELSDIASLVSSKIDVQDAPFDFSVELDNIDSGTGRLLGTTDAAGLLGQRVRFRPGDVLFAKLRPYLRKFWFAEEEGMASTETWVLRADAQRCLPRYLYFLIRSHAFLGEANRPTGSRMPRADWDWVQSTPLPVPGTNEQGRIIDLLTLAEERWAITRDQCAAIRQQKRGLMQQLLTGKLRVPESIDRLIPAVALDAAA